MKYKVLIFIFIVLYQSNIYSQNLVPNPSFEQNTASFDSTTNYCVLGLGGFNLGQIPPWDSPSGGSPDPYDTCSPPFSGTGVPNSLYGYQQPHTGHGMAGATLFQSNGFREYIQVPLTTPLVFDHKYCASFFVNLADTVIVASNNFGMYFSDVHINDSSNQNNLNYTPQINSTAIVTDQFNWTEITGQYTAHGGESYIIIGNFFSNSLTNTVSVTGWSSVPWAYYFIDDVSIRDCTNDGVDELNSAGFKVYPTITNSEIKIEIKNAKAENISVYNVLGGLVYNEKVNSKNFRIDVSNLIKGIYFIEIQTEKGGQTASGCLSQQVWRKKIIKE